MHTNKEGQLKLGSHIILSLVDYNFSAEIPQIREDVFDNDFKVTQGYGIRSATGSMTLIDNADDTTGQLVLETAYNNQTLITNFELYISPTKYWESDTDTDPLAGVKITNYDVSIAAGGEEMIKIALNFEFSGAYKLTSS